MRYPSILAPWLLGGACVFAQTPAAGTAGQTTTPSRRVPSAAATGTLQAATPVSQSANVLKRVRLALAPAVGAAEKYRLFDALGQPVAAAIRAGNALEADVQPGKVYALVPPVAGRRSVTAAKQEFPARYVTFDQNGAPFNEGGLFLQAARVPLVWDDQARAYSTELVVGYDFKDGHEQALATAKTVTFFADGSNARIKADTVVINRSGVAGYQRVVLSTNQLDGETSFTARAGPVDELQASASIEREPGSLDLSFPSRQIDAFGLGTGSLSVSLLARDGSPLAAAQALQIHLSSGQLRLPTLVTLPAGQITATAELRSVGLGSDEIKAEVGGLKGSLAIRVVFPLLSAGAAMLGGVLGGCARYLRNKRKGAALLGRRLFEGLLVGVLFVSAAWAGLVTIEINNGILTTPFGAFVLAAFSGYLGCVVLDRVANRTFRNLTPAT